MADFLKFTNNATSILSVSIGAGDTLITVGSGDGALYPTLGASEFFYATLEDGSGNLEIVKVTARSGDNFTVERGADNTTAQAWAMNATRVELRLTAIVVEEFLQKNGGIMTGELDMDGNYIKDGLLRAGAATTRYVSGSEVVDVPLRGTAGGTGNQITVPTNGTDRAQAAGALSGGPDDILVAGDDLVAGGVIGSASETAEGVIEIADDTEMGAGTDDLKAVTPAKFAETNAEEADGTSPGHFGTTRFAQTAEITPDTPTVDNAAISPARLIDRTATEDRVGLIELADQAEVDAGIDDTKAVTPAKLANASNLPGSFRGAKAYHIGTLVGAAGPGQEIPRNDTPAFTALDSPQEAPVALDGEVYDTDNIHDPVTNNSRMTVPAGVTKVQLRGGITKSDGFSGVHHLRIRRNGNYSGIDPNQGDWIPHTSSGSVGSTSQYGLCYIDSGVITVQNPGTDYYELYVLNQNTLSDGVDDTCWFEMIVIE